MSRTEPKRLNYMSGERPQVGDLAYKGTYKVMEIGDLIKMNNGPSWLSSKTGIVLDITDRTITIHFMGVTHLATRSFDFGEHTKKQWAENFITVLAKATPSKTFKNGAKNEFE